MPEPINRYRDRVMSCWLGKAVGGTLGMPFECLSGPFDVDFYTPVPTEMVANDDLDLQVLWACVLDETNPVRVDRHVLAAAWSKHCAFPWDEYGVATRNLAEGLTPPQTGSFDNWFTRGMGAAIRSELWACLAPGNPALAAKYAYEDACLDHAGDGIWAEVFLATLESAAFTGADQDALLHIAEAALPEGSEARQAARDTRLWWRETPDWPGVREKILTRWGHENATDVVMNLAFTVLAWLAGEGDFSRTICIAVNCGKDTDCTAATAGGSPKNPQTPPTGRHTDGSNYAFADGHVKWLRGSQVPDWSKRPSRRTRSREIRPPERRTRPAAMSARSARFNGLRRTSSLDFVPEAVVYLRINLKSPKETP